MLFPGHLHPSKGILEFSHHILIILLRIRKGYGLLVSRRVPTMIVSRQLQTKLSDRRKCSVNVII
jgi:hypothetical protein